MYISLWFIHVQVFLCEIVYFHVYVHGDVVVYGILCVLIFVYKCIHVCVYSTALLLIACIIGLCWLCIIVSCEFALQILE